MNCRFRRISVNFSSVLFDGRAQYILSSILEKTNCPPDAITIEITETILLKKSDAIQSEFNAIRQLGVTIAIDDFGTGFSSLSYLSEFQVDILKTDRTFLQQAIKDNRSKTILKTMIDMGHALNMTVVCEGAETHAERSLLKAVGADVLQGFVDGHPMEFSEALELVGRDKRKNFRLASI